MRNSCFWETPASPTFYQSQTILPLFYTKNSLKMTRRSAIRKKCKERNLRIYSSLMTKDKKEKVSWKYLCALGYIPFEGFAVIFTFCIHITHWLTYKHCKVTISFQYFNMEVFVPFKPNQKSHTDTKRWLAKLCLSLI